MIRRIELINRSAERIMRGEVKHRIPVSQANDEFDRLSENLNRMLEEIERLVGGIRAVTDNIAHDLRSPLTRLKNRLEMAMAESGDPAERRAAIERAIQETDQLLATFAALLSIADAESGARRGDVSSVDLGEVASDVVELYQPVAEEHGLALEMSVQGAVAVKGNRQLLLQAVANLIDNAVKYGGGGHRIQVEVAAQPEGPVDLRGRRRPRDSRRRARPCPGALRPAGCQPDHLGQRAGAQPRRRHRPAAWRDPGADRHPRRGEPPGPDGDPPLPLGDDGTAGRPADHPCRAAGASPGRPAFPPRPRLRSDCRKCDRHPRH